MYLPPSRLCSPPGFIPSTPLHTLVTPEFLFIICPYTGGKPLFTHWVHAEYMVGSETKYPAWTHWVHFDHFCNSPPIRPLKYPQVHVEYFQKVPTPEPAEGGLDLPTGSILINFIFRPHFAHPDTHRAHVEYFYKVPTQVPANRRGGYIQKVPIKNPVGKCWSNYKRNP